jgi:hypothetical protein
MKVKITLRTGIRITIAICYVVGLGAIFVVPVTTIAMAFLLIGFGLVMVESDYQLKQIDQMKLRTR